MPLRLQRSEGVGAIMTGLDRSIQGLIGAVAQILFSILPSVVFLAIAVAIIHEVVTRLPEGYDAMVGERGGLLSASRTGSRPWSTPIASSSSRRGGSSRWVRTRSSSGRAGTTPRWYSGNIAA